MALEGVVLMTKQTRRNRLARLFGLESLGAEVVTECEMRNPFAGFVDDELLPQNAKRRKRDEEEEQPKEEEEEESAEEEEEEEFEEEDEDEELSLIHI